MEIQRLHADPRIRRFVRSFAERHATLGQGVVTAPLPARPDQFIEFYLQDRYRVSHDDAPPAFAPEFVVVGPQSYRSTRLFLSGSLQVFTIRFQPGGFHALFGVPMTELVDEGVAAADVLGPLAAGLRDAVLRARSFPERAEAAQRWIMACVDQGRRVDRVARLAELIERAHGRLRVDALARYAGLSDRQFTRRFEAQVGLQPNCSSARSASTRCSPPRRTRPTWPGGRWCTRRAMPTSRTSSAIATRWRAARPRPFCRVGEGSVTLSFKSGRASHASMPDVTGERPCTGATRCYSVLWELSL